MSDLDPEDIELIVFANDKTAFRKAIKIAQNGCCLYLSHRSDYFERAVRAVREIYVHKRRVGRLYAKDKKTLQDAFRIAWDKEDLSGIVYQAEGMFWQHLEIMGEHLKRLLAWMGKLDEFHLSNKELADIYARPDYYDPLVMRQMRQKVSNKKLTEEVDGDGVFNPAGDD